MKKHKVCSKVQKSQISTTVQWLVQITQKQTNWDSNKAGGATNPVLQIEANMLKSRIDPLLEDS